MASVGPARPEVLNSRSWADHGAGDDLEGRAAGPPQLAAVLRRVGDHVVLAVDDDLVALLAVVRGHRDRGRRTPADLGVPFRAPQFLASAAVERGDEGRRALLLLNHDQPVAVEQRRRGRAVEGAQLAERLVPDDLAVHVERQQPVVPEVGVDALAVGRRRGGGVAVLGVGAVPGRRRAPPWSRGVCRTPGRRRARSVRRRPTRRWSGRSGLPRRSARSCRCPERRPSSGRSPPAPQRST